MESRLGRDDWHTLNAKSTGLAYCFDCSRCIHFEVKNNTDKSRVSLDFRVLIYRKSCDRSDDGLCPKDLIENEFSTNNPNFYDEAVIDLRRSRHLGLDFVVKRDTELVDPSQFLSSFRM
jgi:hypothetical protein